MLMLIIVVASWIWVYFDAKSIGVRKGLVSGFLDISALVDGVGPPFFYRLVCFLFTWPNVAVLKPPPPSRVTRGRHDSPHEHILDGYFTMGWSGYRWSIYYSSLSTFFNLYCV